MSLNVLYSVALRTSNSDILAGIMKKQFVEYPVKLDSIHANLRRPTLTEIHESNGEALLKHVEFMSRSGFNAISKARFMQFCFALCQHLDKPLLSNTVASFAEIYFFNKSMPQQMHMHDMAYVINAAKRIHKFIVEIKQTFYSGSDHVADVVHLPHAYTCRLYSLLWLLELALKNKAVLEDVAPAKAKKGHVAFYNTFEAIHNFATHNMALVPQDAHWAQIFVEKFAVMMTDAMGTCAAILKQAPPTEFEIYRLCLGLLRCASFTSGRLYQEDSQMGQYETHTAGVFFDRFCSLGCMMRERPFPSMGGHTLAEIDVCFLQQLMDSAYMYLHAISTKGASDASVRDMKIRYARLPSPAYVCANDKDFDKRIYCDVYAPDLYSSLVVVPFNAVVIPSQSTPVHSTSISVAQAFDVGAFYAVLPE
jgi:hypothetical protein